MNQQLTDVQPTTPLWRQLFRLFAPFIGLIVVYTTFLILAGDSRSAFVSIYNTKTILQIAVQTGIAAIGMTMVIITAGIDLSIGSLIALTTVVTAQLLRLWAPSIDAGGLDDAGSFAQMGWILLPLAAMLIGALAAGLCGVINGVLIAALGIVPFIVTLGMMQIARGTAKAIAGNTTVNPPATWLPALMKIEPVPGAWWSIAPGVWMMLVLTAVFWVILRYTTFGRHVYAVGSNEATARLCGINVPLIRVAVYALSGLLTGVAGVLQLSAMSVGDPTGGIAFELDVIASVIIGGGSFSGGEGSVVGAIIGAIIISTLRNGCAIVGLENYVQNILIGAIIIIAVGVDQLKHRRQA